jgi:hypothetical protein
LNLRRVECAKWTAGMFRNEKLTRYNAPVVRIGESKRLT